MSLYESPPESVLIDGTEYQVETDFRVWVAFQGILLGKDTDQQKAEKITAMMDQMGLPQTKEALEAMLRFYAGASTEKTTGGKNVEAFDFEQDSEYIFSAFYEAYRIDLSVDKVHWWRFKSLFKSLPEDCELCKIMRYRTADLKKLPKEQRQFYREMKARYALDGAKQPHMTEQDMKDHVRKRFEEAQSRMSQMRSREQSGHDRP